MSSIKEGLTNLQIRIEDKLLKKVFGTRVLEYEHPREEREPEEEPKTPVSKE